LSGAGVVVVGVLLAGWFTRHLWLAAPTPPDTKAAPEPSRPVVLRSGRTLMLHTKGVRSLAVSPDGALLASGGLDRKIYLWDTTTWRARGPLEGHTGEVSSLAFSPNGTRLASVTSAPDACLIRVWDVAAGRQVESLGMGQQGMWDVAYSSDGRALACGGWDRELHLFDVKTGAERFSVPDVGPFHLRALSFSPDGRQIATGGSGHARLWDTGTGEEVTTHVKLPDGMAPAAILAGGKQVAGWTYPDGRVTLCELPSGRVLAAWRAHPEKIEGLAVSPDSRFLASIGDDGVARVWSTADYTEVATCLGHKGPVFAVSFAPDGTWLATGGHADFTVRIWELPTVCRVAR